MIRVAGIDPWPPRFLGGTENDLAIFRRRGNAVLAQGDDRIFYELLGGHNARKRVSISFKPLSTSLISSLAGSCTWQVLLSKSKESRTK